MARQITVSTTRQQGTIRLGDNLDKFRGVGAVFASASLDFAAHGEGSPKCGYDF